MDVYYSNPSPSPNPNPTQSPTPNLTLNLTLNITLTLTLTRWTSTPWASACGRCAVGASHGTHCSSRLVTSPGPCPHPNPSPNPNPNPNPNQGRVSELRRRVGRDAERLDASHCPPALRLLIEACWRQSPAQVTSPSPSPNPNPNPNPTPNSDLKLNTIQRPTFDELNKLNLEGLGSDEAALKELELLAAARAAPPTRSYSRGKLARGAAAADEPLPAQHHQPVYRPPEPV